MAITGTRSENQNEKVLIAELAQGNSVDGMKIATTASELLAFHGSTPVNQYSFLASLGTSFISTSLGFGFSTSDAVVNIQTAVNTILALLREKGLMASA